MHCNTPLHPTPPIKGHILSRKNHSERSKHPGKERHAHGGKAHRENTNRKKSEQNQFLYLTVRWDVNRFLLRSWTCCMGRLFGLWRARFSRFRRSLVIFVLSSLCTTTTSMLSLILGAFLLLMLVRSHFGVPSHFSSKHTKTDPPKR